MKDTNNAMNFINLFLLGGEFLNIKICCRHRSTWLVTCAVPSVADVSMSTRAVEAAREVEIESLRVAVVL